MAKVIMIQGTMSNAGKSLLTAGLCRIFRQDGYRVCPFKSQNMALNSFITEDGLEMGRAQAVQAEAAGIEPSVYMNPVLLKPVSHTGSQVIVNGEVLGNMSAKEYFAYKSNLLPDIRKAFQKLEEQADIIVIEGAGSPAEINLKEHDIVNMGLAELVDAPVLLVGDIDRGGVFAQLLGTLLLLEELEKRRVKGLIINKFRGDKSILAPGITMLEERAGVPVFSVPYMELAMEDEDSLSNCFAQREEGILDIAVIHYPRISNFTDLTVFAQMKEVSVRYVDSVAKLHEPDMILLPGSKNTMSDLLWLRQNGLETAIKRRAADTLIMGICGGYQMLGKEISDPQQVEHGGVLQGLGLLPVITELKAQKVRTRVKGHFQKLDGILKGLSGMALTGYEIHMGQTSREEGAAAFAEIYTEVRTEQVMTNQESELFCTDGCFLGNVYGTYIHGVFDNGEVAKKLIALLAERKGVYVDMGGLLDYADFKEQQYDRLAEGLRASLDMKQIYEMLCEAAI